MRLQSRSLATILRPGGSETRPRRRPGRSNAILPFRNADLELKSSFASRGPANLSGSRPGTEVSMCASAVSTAAPSALELFVAAGVVHDHDNIPSHLQLFAAQSDRVLR